MASNTRLSQAALLEVLCGCAASAARWRGGRSYSFALLGEGWLHRFKRQGGAPKGDRKITNRMAAVLRPTDPDFPNTPAGDGAGVKVFGVGVVALTLARFARGSRRRGVGAGARA